MLRHPYNLGIGGAVQSGYMFASERGYDIAVQVDGDGQHDPRCLGFMLEHLTRTRSSTWSPAPASSPTTATGFRSSAPRRLGIRIFAGVLSRIVGQQVTDPTSGLRMAGRRGIDLFARDYPHDYPEVEAVLLMHAHQLASVELPVKMRERTGGVSSINSTRSVYYMIKVLLAVFVGLFRARPTVRAGGPAPVAGEPGI